MAEIRFTQLKSLLQDMKNKGWCIETFPFEFNGKNCIAILRPSEDKDKPKKFAELEFIKADNINSSIMAYADFFKVSFYLANDFYAFFEIKPSIETSGGRIFSTFSEYFSKFIPEVKTDYAQKPKIEKELIVAKVEKDKSNHIYCYDVHRTGEKENGEPKQRSIENDNKARMLRPNLYEKFKQDRNFSFFFSDKREDEKTDEAIMKAVAQRNY